MDTALGVAVIAGAFSLAGIGATAVIGVRAAKADNSMQKAIKELEAKLATQRDEAAAQRDYLYVARKRLYSEVNPQLFRLREQCEPTMWRVRRIINGEISVEDPKHIMTSTWRLVGPLVIAQEIQGHLTAVDLRVDPGIRAQYIVSREVLRVLHDGKALARVEPVLPYPEKPRQHLTYAQLQRLVDVCTIAPSNGQPRRPIKLSELADRAAEPDVRTVLDRTEELFKGATPSTRPVLWRVLLAYACLMSTLIDLVDQQPTSSEAKPIELQVRRILPIDVDIYSWPGGDGPTFESQLGAVDRYVRDKLSLAGLVVTAAR